MDSPLSIKKSLSVFRAQTPGVQAIALADLSTGTVLVSESAIPMGQEEFDALARRAGRLLAGAADGEVGMLAYEADPSASRLFMRNENEIDDALILLVNGTGEDPRDLAALGSAIFTALAGGDPT